MAAKFGFDTDYVWDIDIKCTYVHKLVLNNGIVVAIKITTCTVNNFFLHEKIS